MFNDNGGVCQARHKLLGQKLDNFFFKGGRACFWVNKVTGRVMLYEFHMQGATVEEGTGHATTKGRKNKVIGGYIYICLGGRCSPFFSPKSGA